MDNLYTLNGRQAKRAYEHGVAPNFNRKSTQNNDARKFFYKTLMNVTINNEFYNANNNKPSDYTVSVTSQSMDLMRTLGLIFKNQGDSFSVIYNEENEKNLLRFLKQQKEDGFGYWTRLSFMIIVNNALFVNFSELYFDTNPSTNNFYLSNQQAHDDNGIIILNREEYINQKTQDYYDVVPVQYEVNFLSAITIEVCDISGEVLLCLPKCVPVDLVELSRTGLITCLDVISFLEKYPLASCKDRENIYIDFSIFSEGLYTISWLDSDKQIIFEENVIYTLSSPSPLFYVDLLFSNPSENEPGIFPINLELDTIKSINYNMNFNRRSTYWIYWVFVKDREIKRMVIRPDRGNYYQFEQQETDTMAGGDDAFWFVSKQPIPLQNNPTYFFTLIDITDPEDEYILSKPLEVASAMQVVTKDFLTIDSNKLHQPPNSKYSEIFIYV